MAYNNKNTARDRFVAALNETARTPTSPALANPTPAKEPTPLELVDRLINMPVPETPYINVTFTPETFKLTQEFAQVGKKFVDNPAQQISNMIAVLKHGYETGTDPDAAADLQAIYEFILDHVEQELKGSNYAISGSGVIKIKDSPDSVDSGFDNYFYKPTIH